MTVLEKLRGSLVVSCQPVDDGPMDLPKITAAMALAAEAGGAAGLRIEGINNLEVIRPLTRLPIIGIIKTDLSNSPVRISPFLENVMGLTAAGADIVAYDATDRSRPVATADLVGAIKQHGKLAMADCATLSDAQTALAEGADIIGTTLSGYAYDIAPRDAGPDLDLIRTFSKLGGFVMAEGRLNSPHLAKLAMESGADCVTVGSAVTRVEHITNWFARAVDSSQGNHG
jgi:N-acylglucosamine-6-phosphate 2-epimerase